MSYSVLNDRHKNDDLIPSTEGMHSIDHVSAYVQIEGTTYFIPNLGHRLIDFNKEINTKWPRVTYEQAVSICDSYSSKLITADEIHSLASSGKAVSWPKMIPYWIGVGKVRLFGESFSATTNSRLYFACSNKTEG